MSKKKRSKRPIFFVCSGLIDGKLASENLEAFEKKIAEEKFKEKFGALPQIVFGPFYRKKIFQPQIRPTDIVFSSEIKQAEFNGWIVHATILKSPENFAFLLFDRRIDGKKMAKPQGSKIIPIDEIIFRTT